MKRWLNKIVITLGLIAIFLPIPFPISQKVSVTIVDKFGKPVVENTVRQDWKYETIWTKRENHEVRQTDRNGYIYFPEFVCRVDTYPGAVGTGPELREVEKA
jgi:hypothetical protein